MGCGRITRKSELLRVAVVGDEVVADPGAILPGRGAYLCPDPRCRDAALARSAFGRAFRRTVAADAKKLDLEG